MKIALAQMEVARGDLVTNLKKIESMLRDSAQAGAGTVFFPEMCATGFDWDYNGSILDEAQVIIRHIQHLAVANNIAVSGSFLEKTEAGNAANTLYYIEADGTVAAKYRKVHLFTLFNEQAHVEAGKELVVAQTLMGKLGCSICYDLRFPELFRACMQQGAVVQYLPAAFPHPRLTHWQTLVRARATENQSFFIAVNQCGKEQHGGFVGSVNYFGHSMVVAPSGEIVFEADASECLQFVEMDTAIVSATRKQLPALDDRQEHLYSK